MQQVRQGDILFTRATPTGTLRRIPAVAGRLIVAEGEATGHHHSIAESHGTLSLDEGGVMWLTVEELTAVEHQEHQAIPLPPGTYRVTRQREWTDADEPRQVLD